LGYTTASFTLANIFRMGTYTYTLRDLLWAGGFVARWAVIGGRWLGFGSRCAHIGKFAGADYPYGTLLIN